MLQAKIQLKASFARFGILKFCTLIMIHNIVLINLNSLLKPEHRRGMVERHIQTIKSLLKKDECEGRDSFLV